MGQTIDRKSQKTSDQGSLNEVYTDWQEGERMGQSMIIDEMDRTIS